MPTFKEYFLGQEISMEALADGIKRQELEFTMYVLLSDLNELKKKAVKVETHEQWSIHLDEKENTVEGKVRIRLIDNIRAVLTSKIKRDQQVGSEETEQEISMDMFNALREMTTDGYIKTRYIVPSNIMGQSWEVDVFYANGGAQHPWVKVDLEVKDLNDPIPIFPLAHDRVIYADGEMTHTDRLKVKSLWETEWQNAGQHKKKYST